MPEIDFSFMIHTSQTIDVLTALMKEFETQSGVHVNLHPLYWNTSHAELNKIALYHHGPDVSEIGSTWVSDLIAMNALRPFSTPEIFHIGKPEDFAEGSWQTGHLVNDATQWAIPWLAETFVIHYRRDLLEKAGIDEKQAFQTHQKIAETVACLQESCDVVSIELPMQRFDIFTAMHVLSSWVWTAGGDFCSADGKKVLFNQPKALAAVRSYFNLVRNLPKEMRAALQKREQGWFEQGHTAISFGTLMLYSGREKAAPLVRDNWRVASLPGEHFMGGSNLVVWKHARNERAALDLVRFLTSTQMQVRCALPLATLPPRLAALASPQIANDPALSVFAESIRTGRPYRGVPLWGLIEDRLMNTIIQMGEKVVNEDDLDVDNLVNTQLDALARRLNITLAQ